MGRVSWPEGTKSNSLSKSRHFFGLNSLLKCIGMLRREGMRRLLTILPVFILFVSCSLFERRAPSLVGSAFYPSPQEYLSLGIAEMAKGHPARAEVLYQKSCDGGAMGGCLNLGVMEEQRGEQVRAELLYRKACEGGEIKGVSKPGNLAGDPGQSSGGPGAVSKILLE